MGEWQPIRTFKVHLQGFDPGYYSARSRGKAKAAAYRAYQACNNSASFHDFLCLSPRVESVPTPPSIGKRVMIGGRPATSVFLRGTINPDWAVIGYMRDDEDVIFTAHASEVMPLPARPCARKGDAR